MVSDGHVRGHRFARGIPFSFGISGYTLYWFGKSLAMRERGTCALGANTVTQFVRAGERT